MHVVHYVHLHATSKDAFRLTASPRQFLATQTQLPSSGLLLRPCTMRKKNKDPLGSSILWDRGSSLSVSTRSPSLYHSMVGVGRPSALQFKVVGSPLETMTSEGCSTIRGGKSSWRRRDPIKHGRRKTSFQYFLIYSFVSLKLTLVELNFNYSKSITILFLFHSFSLHASYKSSNSCME